MIPHPSSKLGDITFGTMTLGYRARVRYDDQHLLSGDTAKMSTTSISGTLMLMSELVVHGVDNLEALHPIPVPSLAAELIESIKPNDFGWYFRSEGSIAPVSHGTLYSFVRRQRDRGVRGFVIHWPETRRAFTAHKNNRHQQN
jgi:hypothetical protein